MGSGFEVYAAAIIRVSASAKRTISLGFIESERMRVRNLNTMAASNDNMTI